MYPASIDNPNHRRTYVGWDGSLSVQSFDAKVLEAQRFMQPLIMREHWGAQSFGLTPVPLMKSQRAFTPNSVSNFWDLREIAHLERRWMILTSS